MKQDLINRVNEVEEYLSNNEFEIIEGKELIKKTENKFEEDYGKFALNSLSFLTLETYNKPETFPNLIMKNTGYILISMAFAMLFTLMSLSIDMFVINLFLSIFAVLIFSNVLLELFERTKEDCEFEFKNEKINKEDLLLIYHAYGYDGLDYLLSKYKEGISLRDFVNEFKVGYFEKELLEFKDLKNARNMIISGLNEEIRKTVEDLNG